MGIIDTLSAGFQFVARRPWLLVIPLLLDLFLWLGPQLSIDPVLDQIGAAYQQALTGQLAVMSQMNVDAAQLDDLQAQSQALLEGLKSINLFGLLAFQMPSLIYFGPQPVPGLHGLMTVTIPSTGRLISASIGLILVGLVWTSAYNCLIALYLRNGRFEPPLYFDRLGVNWLRLLGLYLVILLAALIVGLPLLLIASALSLLIPPLGAATTVVLWSLAIWVLWVQLFFAGAAIFMADLNPLLAIKSSIQVVQRHFWSSLVFIGLVYLITLGTYLLWTNNFRANVALFSVALLGHAFVSTGLTTATMLFYRDRTKVQEEQPPVRA